MRMFSSSFAAHLASGTTTLCTCWKLTCRDGTVLGFTDHDNALTFEGVTYEPASGLAVSDVPASLGLSVDTAEISGALQSDRLNAADIEAGLYDGAQLAFIMVNWTDVTQRVLMHVGVIGEMTRQGQMFTAEMRSLAQALDQTIGRVYQSGCDARLGDARCGVDLTAAGRRANGVVSSLAGSRSFFVTGLGGFAQGRGTRGHLLWTSGANSGRSFDVRRDSADATGRLLELWTVPARGVQTGDAFTLTIGCDKTFATCTALFSNAVNFCGFPHMPGTDFALSYVKDGAGGYDGGPVMP